MAMAERLIFRHCRMGRRGDGAVKPPRGDGSPVEGCRRWIVAGKSTIRAEPDSTEVLLGGI